jgi:hypothetical protein
MSIDGVWIPILAIATAPIIAIGLPIARAYARRLESGTSRAAIPNDVTVRLERMEQAIDSIAVEVERISEGQRFTTKLLSDRVQAPSSTVLGGAAPRRES